MLEDQPTLWRWAATIVYIGAGLVMLGILLLMISYISGASLFVFSLVLLVSAMGVLLAWVGLRAESGAPRQGTVAEEHGDGAPLLYLESKVTRSHELMAKLSGEKALGFVMLFLGSFVLVISITIGAWFGLGAMIIVGGAATASGALLRWKR